MRTIFFTFLFLISLRSHAEPLDALAGIAYLFLGILALIYLVAAVLVISPSKDGAKKRALYFFYGALGSVPLVYILLQTSLYSGRRFDLLLPPYSAVLSFLLLFSWSIAFCSPILLSFSIKNKKRIAIRILSFSIFILLFAAFFEKKTADTLNELSDDLTFARSSDASAFLISSKNESKFFILDKAQFELYQQSLNRASPDGVKLISEIFDGATKHVIKKDPGVYVLCSLWGECSRYDLLPEKNIKILYASNMDIHCKETGECEYLGTLTSPLPSFMIRLCDIKSAKVINPSFINYDCRERKSIIYSATGFVDLAGASRKFRYDHDRLLDFSKSFSKNINHSHPCRESESCWLIERINNDERGTETISCLANRCSKEVKDLIRIMNL